MEENKEILSTHVIKESEQTGRVVMLDDVFNVIAGIAAKEVNNGSSLSGSIAKSVKSEVADAQVRIFITMNVSFDSSIPKLAAEVQNRVKSAVESMTEFEVTAVNIRIDDVETVKPAKEK